MGCSYLIAVTESMWHLLEDTAKILKKLNILLPSPFYWRGKCLQPKKLFMNVGLCILFSHKQVKPSINLYKNIFQNHQESTFLSDLRILSNFIYFISEL